MPEEVRAAKRINAEGERIIEKAQEEAERIVARAQEQAAFLIDERGPDPGGRRRRAGRSSPTRIADADEIRRGADEYAVSVLVGLEGDVVKTLTSIKKGIAMLDERRASLDGEGPGVERGRRREPLGGRGGRADQLAPVTSGASRSTGRSRGMSPACWAMSPAPSASPGRAASRSTSARTCTWPRRSTAGSASCGPTAASSPAPPPHCAGPELQPLPARRRAAGRHRSSRRNSCRRST